MRGIFKVNGHMPMGASLAHASGYPMASSRREASDGGFSPDGITNNGPSYTPRRARSCVLSSAAMMAPLSSGEPLRRGGPAVRPIA
jgi:hypothetical protein